MSYLILHKDRAQGLAIWWRAERSGYTTDVSVAGRYTLDEALSIARIRGDDFPVDEEEIGRSLQPRMIISVDDGDNFLMLKQFETQRIGEPENK